jgi:O-antigen ligase
VKSPRSSAAPPRKDPGDSRLGMIFLWLLVLGPPFVLAPVAAESFRQPKLLASEWLALGSLACLAWGLRRAGTVRLAEIWRLPALRLVLPLLLVATAGLAFTRHPLHARDALIDLWIGAAALVGWSAGVPRPRLRKLILGFLAPATALAAVAILQFHDLWQPLQFFGMAPATRLAVTSFAGNPGDLAAFLVLPALIAQESLRRRWREREARTAVWGIALALAACVYAIFLTQTLAAVAALIAGSVLLWLSRLPRRLAPALVVGSLLAAALLVLAVPPLRERVAVKLHQAAAGDWNFVLTGRLDGWRAAAWMLESHPLTGVGAGGYLPEFVPAKLALLDRGVAFHPDLTLSVFPNAHDEFLTAGAEWGLPGLLALAWGLWVLLGALRRLEPRERVPAVAGLAGLLVLSIFDFPFRLALVGYPALLFLAWILHPPAAGGEEDRRGGLPALPVAAALTVLLVLAWIAQTVRWRDIAVASRLLGTVKALSLAMSSSGQAPPQIVAENLVALRRAQPLDPVEVGIPVARGGQYLFFLHRPEEAAEAYREALDLEPHPEAYMGLGKALWMAGRREEARPSLDRAVRLSPYLARELPAAGAP